MPYKNVETLIRGAALVPEFELHLLSKIDVSRKTELSDLAKNLGAKVVFHGGVTDSEYISLLQDSFALVTASKDEGFGIPLVEAMQQGTPVVVSDLEIFHEVAGDAGKYFKADDAVEFAKRIEELEGPSAWENASADSLAQAKKFNWDTSADALLKLFSEIR